MNRRTRMATDDLICYIILTLFFAYLSGHVIYAFVREDSAFRNLDQYRIQARQQIIYSNSLDYNDYFDGDIIFTSEYNSEY